MKQGCRLARLFGKSIMDFYARNQYFLVNTQPNGMAFFTLVMDMIFPVSEKLRKMKSKL